MYNLDFAQRLEEHNRHLYGNSDPDEVRANAERMFALPRDVETVECYEDANGEFVPKKRPEPKQVKWGGRTLLVIPKDGGRHVLGEMYSATGKLDNGNEFSYNYAVPILKKDQKSCRRFLSVYETRGVGKITFAELPREHYWRGSSVEGVVASEGGGMRIANLGDILKFDKLKRFGI